MEDAHVGSYDHGDSRQSRREAKRQRVVQQRQEVVVGSIDGPTLLWAIDAVLRDGGALRIGRTRDGGAWAFGVYGDGEKPYTEYVQASEDVNEYLKDLAGFFEQTGGKSR